MSFSIFNFLNWDALKSILYDPLSYRIKFVLAYIFISYYFFFAFSLCFLINNKHLELALMHDFSVCVMQTEAVEDVKLKE